MVTSYYISNLSKKNKKFEIEEYYQELLENFVYLKTKDSVKSSCRVCLKPRSIPISSQESPSDILAMLSFLGNINVEENDELPKNLCTNCFTFIKTAILFQKKAKQTDAALKQYKYFKIETKRESQDVGNLQEFSDSSNHNDDKVEDSWATEDNWPDQHTTDNWEVQERNITIKEEKKEHEKVKVASKITCRFCGKIVTRSYYREHLTMHDPNPHQWVCEICGKSFRLRCAYYNHSHRHRTDFPHKCPLCPYRGRYKELLKTHMRTHSGDYRYMCTECPARFLFKSNLNTHMLKHKEPQFKCDSCKRAFHSKLFLERHYEADHLGIKNHVCNICGKAFGYRNAMMKHQRHVHKREKSMFGRMPSYLAEKKHDEGNNANIENKNN